LQRELVRLSRDVVVDRLGAVDEDAEGHGRSSAASKTDMLLNIKLDKAH
jgi:hypothetical protein